MFYLQANQKRLLSNLNPFFLSLLVLFLILIKSTSEALLPTVLRDWDLLLPVIIYLGQRRALIEGVILTLFICHLFSLNTAAPIGLFSIYYLGIFFLARLVAYVVYANNSISVLMLIFLLSVVSRVLLPLVARLFDHSIFMFSGHGISFLSLLLNTIAGFVSYWLLVLLDRLTFKVPPRNIEFEDGAL